MLWLKLLKRREDSVCFPGETKSNRWSVKAFSTQAQPTGLPPVISFAPFPGSTQATAFSPPAWCGNSLRELTLSKTSCNLQTAATSRLLQPPDCCNLQTAATFRTAATSRR